MRPTSFLVVLLALAACDHTSPYAIQNPDPLGPSSASPPIRLTFNPGEDWHPSASGEFIVFSRLEDGRSDLDRCIAVLPAAGGTLTSLTCAGGTRADDVLDAWIEPSVSSDRRLAYVRDQGRRYAFGPETRRLVVTPLEQPDSIEFALPLPFRLEDGRTVSAAHQLSWPQPGIVRFLALSEDYVVEPPARPDTVFTAYRLVELSTATGELRELGLTEGAFAHVPSPDGGVWFLRGDAPDELRYLPPGGDSVLTAGRFSGAAVALASADQAPLAVVEIVVVNPGTGQVSVSWELEWLDLESGLSAGRIDAPGRPGRVAGIPGSRRLVVEVFGEHSADLWMLELP